MTSSPPKSYKRARNLDRDVLSTFDLGFTDFDKKKKYVDTPWTALLHPKGFSLQLGASFTYRTLARSPVKYALLREIVESKDHPREFFFFAQHYVSQDDLCDLGYAGASLGMDVDKELAVTNEYSFIPMEQATGNCMVLTHEQHKFLVKPGNRVDQTFYYRYVSSLVMFLLLFVVVVTIFGCVVIVVVMRNNHMQNVQQAYQDLI